MNGLMEEGSTTTREGGLAQVRLRARVGQLFDSRGTTARERASERARTTKGRLEPIRLELLFSCLVVACVCVCVCVRTFVHACVSPRTRVSRPDASPLTSLSIPPLSYQSQNRGHSFPPLNSTFSTRMQQCFQNVVRVPLTGTGCEGMPTMS